MKTCCKHSDTNRISPRNPQRKFQQQNVLGLLWNTPCQACDAVNHHKLVSRFVMESPSV
eukprot:UN25088